MSRSHRVPTAQTAPSAPQVAAPHEQPGHSNSFAVHLADLDLSDGVHRHHRELFGQSELVPPDAQGAFEGYRSLVQAVLRGREIEHTSVILQDSASRYHAVDTGQEPLPAASPDGTAWHVQEHMFSAPGAMAPVRVVRALQEDPVDFEQARADARERRAEAGRDRQTSSYTRAEEAAARELRAIGGRDLSVGSRRMDNLDEYTSTPGDLGVDVQPRNTDTALARAGIAGTVPADAHAPDPAVLRPTFNTSGLDRSRNAVEQTVIHEGTHQAHAQRTLELRRRWQAAGARGSFEDWLRQEQRAGRISNEDALLAIQSLSGETGGTEILARVEAFTSTFHRHPPDQPDAFVQFRTLPGYWVRVAGREQDHEPLRRLAIQRLFHYYQSLDEAHRLAFDRNAADRANFPGSGEQDPQLVAQGRDRLMPELQAFRGRLGAVPRR